MSRHINLYDPGLRRQRHWLTAANLAIAATAMLLLLFVWGYWARSETRRLEAEAAALADQVSALQKQTVALGAELAGRKPDAKLEQDLVALRALLGNHQEILAMLDRGLGAQTGGYAEYLRGLARQTPGGLWLTGFAVSAGGNAMEIRGRTLEPSLLPEYIRRLNAERAFQGRSFAELQVQAATPPAQRSAAPAAGPAYHEFALVPAKLPEAEAPAAAPETRRGR
jgi:hypothetical protein